MESKVLSKLIAIRTYPSNQQNIQMHFTLQVTLIRTEIAYSNRMKKRNYLPNMSRMILAHDVDNSYLC